MKYLLLLLNLTCALNIVSAQTTRLQKFLSANASNNLSLIDSTNYWKVVGVDEQVKVVSISNNYCIGTQHMYKSAVLYDSLYGKKIKCIPCISCPTKELNEIRNVANAFGYTGPVYVVNFDIHKNKWSDDRTSAFKLRNAVCEPCSADEVGSPYYIFYGYDNKIIARGYRSRVDLDSILTEYMKDK
jgi:hypothetical protein